jgi:phosphoglycerate dehydrogenase-like enzyme
MSKVLVAPMTLAQTRGPFHDALIRAGFEPIYPGRGQQLTEEELLHDLQGVRAAIAGMEPYNARVLAAHPGLRVIARVGVGYDAVDVEAATRQGVAVAIAPGTNQEAVAEHTFALLLGLAKDVAAGHNGTRAGRWPRRITTPVRGRTLGIAGLGRIGKAVAVRGVAFGMRVLAHDPIADTAFAEAHGITLVPLDRLFSESDYLSLHSPLTPQSRHMINRRSLALMKPTAFLINTGRGGLVCEEDLVEALRAGKLAGAGLDVFELEPPRPDNPLLALDNVLVTPHTAGTDSQSLADMALSAAEAVISLSRGEWPAEKVVNPEVRERFHW